MVKGSSAITFYREWDDGIARNPPNVGDLVVLKKLCEAVEVDDSRLSRD